MPSQCISISMSLPIVICHNESWNINIVLTGVIPTEDLVLRSQRKHAIVWHFFICDWCFLLIYTWNYFVQKCSANYLLFVHRAYNRILHKASHNVNNNNFKYNLTSCIWKQSCFIGTTILSCTCTCVKLVTWELTRPGRTLYVREKKDTWSHTKVIFSAIVNLRTSAIA